MPKKKNQSQTHGQVEKFVPTTLDQIWGDTGMSKYKTMRVEEYQSYLTSLNKADLQSHAVTVGELPIDNRDTLTKKLIKKFHLHVATYRRPETVTSTTVKNDAARRILAEGK